MTREELIEEAAKAMVERASGETWEDCNQAWYLADAHVAFAVFEKAQAPTDDERKALAQVISDSVGGWNKDTAAITKTRDAILAAGFRRPAQAEPTPFNGKWVCGKCAREVAQGVDDGQIPEHHRTCPKRAQTEPTDAQIEAAAKACMYNGARFIRDNTQGYGAYAIEGGLFFVRDFLRVLQTAGQEEQT